MSSESSPVIAIRRNNKADLTNCMYPVRVRSLLNRGARVVFTGGRQQSMPNADNVIEGKIHQLVQDKKAAAPTVVVGEGELVIGAVLNTYRHDHNSPSLPTLNDVRVREVSGKQHVYTSALSHISPQTFIADGIKSVPNAVEYFDTSDLIVKPVGGMRGKGVVGVDRAELAAILTERFETNPDDKQVVQERIKVHTWHPSIHAFDPEEEDSLHRAKSQEMRLFIINGLILPIARVVFASDPNQFNHAGDAYVALDPDCVPESVYSIGHNAREEIATASGVGHMALAVDLLYGERPSLGHGQPEWYLNEVNSVDPQFPAVNQYPEQAQHLHDTRSDVLIKMAS